MRRFVFVHGSGSSDPAWARPHSPLRTYLYGLGWDAYDHPRGAFRWSGEVGKILWFLNRKDWDAMSDALIYYALPIVSDVGYLDVLSHSHAAQGIVLAAAKGLTIRTWVDVSGPIRKDTLKHYPQARPNIGQHVYVHDEGRFGDMTRLAGQLFDLALGFPREHPFATNVPLQDVGHSGVLTEPKHLHFWKDAILPQVAIT